MGNLEWAKAHFAAYIGVYKRNRDYYYGKQPIRISDQTKEAFEMLLGYTRDNLCPLVCDTLTDRLTLTGFDSEDENASALLNVWWDDLRMVSRSGKVHFDATVQGDAYVIVWPDPNDARIPRIYPQNSANMAVRYEDDGQEERIVEAVKAWRVKGTDGKESLRLTRYLPNRIERYISPNAYVVPGDTSELQPYQDDPGEEAFFNHTYGQVVHRFANSMNPDIYAYSELSDVIPHQDIINKAIADMIVAEEFQGLPIRWITGLTVPIDPKTGQPAKVFKTGADRTWVIGDTEVKFGQFESADLEQFLKILNDERLEIARISRTPLHLMMMNSGDFPSGEALRTAEAPLASKTQKRQVYYGDTWIQVMNTCLAIAGVTLKSKITARWADANPISEAEKIQTLNAKKGIGVSPSQLLAEAGYTDEQIVNMQTENDEAATKLAERAAISFNAGRSV